MGAEPLKFCPTIGALPVGWQVKSLDSFCPKIGTGATPRGGSEVYLNTRTGHALIRSQNVFDRQFDTTGLAFISDSHASELRSAEVKSGDVLLNITGDGVTFGRSCVVPDDVLPACVNQHVAIIRTDRQECDPGYLLSVLTHPAAKSYIESFNAGGSRRAITKGHIESFKIALPPLAVQKVMAKVLGSLDDKILLNRRMNETLEALAQSLFKSWFVDSTQSGRPKGWREVPFTETVEIIGGGTPKTSVAGYWGGDIPWFSVVDSPQHSDLFVIDTEKKITKAGVQNSSTQVLSVGTTIITARGTVGKVALVGVPMAMNQSCYGLRGKAGKKGFHTYFVTHALVSQLQQHAHGSVFDTITRDTLAGVQVSLPPSSVVEQFEEKVSPLMDRILNNLRESRTLAALRDALLPKLLSGELRLPTTK